MLYVFGAVVIYSAIRLLRGGAEARKDIGNNRLLTFLRQRLNVTDEYKGRRFFVREDGNLRTAAYLRYGLSLLLLLVGGKMIASGFVEIPLWITLAATITILASTVGLSLLRRQSA